ncbi:alpha/beta fold hydrolase [Arthrobacter tumbae]|uniref:alpha/beta fold hydrolase n=1 Tax=Arthrobacter tumbae TaxID=163874 RepID=UPI001959183A|nr:alpha/beta fold hydrolase [Arthrobacter tumbae]MBM7782214.1 pimeloyl-ACP methyl ester carboxylesterase [Arthrobacter tumbae]
MLNTEQTGSGTPLVLVHGLGSSIRNWDPILPMLQEQREVIAIDLPGFGKSEPLTGAVSIDTLTAAVEQFLREKGLEGADIVGSSMGARMVVEMARRGHTGNVVALDPGGFWNDTQVRIFNSTITASIALVRRIQSVLPSLVKQAAGRTALLAQFSAAPWKLDPDLVLTELRGFSTSRSLDEARRSLAHGPRQQGAPQGTLKGNLAFGWGRQDKVTPLSEAAVAMSLYPDATLHVFENCGHFPHWDQPQETARFILDSTGW